MAKKRLTEKETMREARYMRGLVRNELVQREAESKKQREFINQVWGEEKLRKEFLKAAHDLKASRERVKWCQRKLREFKNVIKSANRQYDARLMATLERLGV